MEEFNKKQFFEAIKQIAKQNLLTIDEIHKIIEESVKKIFHSKFDPDADLVLTINPDKQIFELINNTKYVVDEEVIEEYKAIEINIKDAKKINKKIKVGETISEIVSFGSYSRTITQLIRQLITQNVKEKRKEAIYAKHKSLKGEMIWATVNVLSNNYVILSLDDGTTAFMPTKFMNSNVQLKMGEKIQVYVEDVLEESKDAQIIVSNTSKIMIKRVLELEVPEILDGIVEIVSISRIPGQRSKVAVKSNNPSVDPVGSIIGSEGQRIKSIIKKLDGEKIDIILWSENKKEFIANSLSPAKVISVIEKKDEQENIIEGHFVIITPNQHQTLAIGKAGSNAKLSVELTNSRIDIISIDEAKERGIDIIWNGNIEKYELESIESGIRNKGEFRRKNNSQHLGFSTNNNFDNYEVDEDILSFNEELSQEKSNFSQNTDSNNEYDFSEEDLDKMQAKFEFNNEFNSKKSEEEEGFDEKEFNSQDL